MALEKKDFDDLISLLYTYKKIESQSLHELKKLGFNDIINFLNQQRRKKNSDNPENVQLAETLYSQFPVKEKEWENNLTKVLSAHNPQNIQNVFTVLNPANSNPNNSNSIGNEIQLLELPTDIKEKAKTFESLKKAYKELTHRDAEKKTYTTKAALAEITPDSLRKHCEQLIANAEEPFTLNLIRFTFDPLKPKDHIKFLTAARKAKVICKDLTVEPKQTKLQSPTPGQSGANEKEDNDDNDDELFYDAEEGPENDDEKVLTVRSPFKAAAAAATPNPPPPSNSTNETTYPSKSPSFRK